MSNYKLNDIQGSVGTGLDAFFASEPSIVSPHGQKTAAAKPARVKVGSLTQLNGFQRLSSEVLVHKSTQDLWAIKREGAEYYIERLFQDNGQPLKG